MPMNLSPVTPAAQWQRRFDNWKKRLDFISRYVGDKREGRFETINPLIPLMLNPLFAPVKAALVRNFQRLAGDDLPLTELFPLMDRSFSTDSGCNGCGVCAKICPVENIEMVDDKPSWRHHCENCFACLAWCPRASIQSGQVSAAERYRHPEVELSDMLRRA
jgi:Pyruvate/2-oxoacid:ferredoxin oxidoreductase delta subunit